MKVIYDGLDIVVYFDYVSDEGCVFSFSGFDAHKTNCHRYADGFIQSLGLSGVFFVQSTIIGGKSKNFGRQ